MMIFRMIAALIWGLIIGISINKTRDKNKKFNDNKEIESLKELIIIYELHLKELKDEAKYYKSGMYEAYEQNADLKRRLNSETVGYRFK